MIYFTADFHLDHANIIRFCDRPFRNVQHMNKALIQNYNSVINDDDEVFIIGDLSIKPKSYKWSTEQMTRNMKGQKHLILGNHDYFGPFDYIDIGFTTVHTALIVEEFVLAHDPSVATAIGDKKLLCGHIHKLFKMQGNALNVGVDVWDFKPVSIEQVRKEFANAENPS